MANQDWAFGLVPIQTLSGGAPWTVELPIKATSTKMYRGQPVCWSTSGYARVYTTQTFAAEQILVSAEYYSGSATMPTKTKGLFWRGDQHIFAINADGAAAVTLIGKYGGTTGTVAGSTITGQSTCEFDSSSSNSSGTDLPMHVLGFHQIVGDTLYASNSILKVQLTREGAFEQTT
jgi:hypothetical protein